MNHSVVYGGNGSAMNDTHNGDEDGMSTQRHWIALLPLPIILFGVVGNILVCMAVTMEKRLQSVTNYFLFSLAITDLLVCLVVWPFNILHEFLGFWPLNLVLCDLFVTLDVLLCTSSILHLCTISLERFLAIRSPLTSRTRTKTAVLVKIVLVWLTALAISSPIMILGFVNQKNILSDKLCVLQNSHFRIYGSVTAFYIPLIIMLIFYGLTVRLLRAQYRLCNPRQHPDGEFSIRRLQSRKSNKVFKKRIQQLHKEQSHRNINRQSTTSSTVSDDSAVAREQTKVHSESNGTGIKHTETIDTSVGGVSDARQGLARVTSDTGQGLGQQQSQDLFYCIADSSDYRLQLGDLREKSFPISETSEIGAEEFLPRSQSADTAETSVPSVSHQSSLDLSTRRFSDMNDNESKVTQTFSAPAGLHDLVRRHSCGPKAKKDSMKQKQEKNSVRTEQKASKTLLILFLFFVLCWAPFFIVNVAEVLCDDCDFPALLVTFFVWLGYVSSTLNPIIYTVFNKTFRVTMLKLLKCQYRAIQRPMRMKAICVGINYALHNRQTDNDNVQIPLS